MLIIKIEQRSNVLCFWCLEHASQTGGLSGPPLFPYALSTLETQRTLLPATVPLIGCDGISSGKDALAFAKAGASSVQLSNAMSVEGAGAARRIKHELVVAWKPNLKPSHRLGKRRGWMWSTWPSPRLANTHPELDSTRQAKLNAPRTEQTFITEAGDLNREAEALQKLLLDAGVEGSDALTEALSDKRLEETLSALGLESPSD